MPPIERRFPHVAAALALLGACVACARPTVAPPEAPPYESLVAMVADLRRFSETDLYRLPPPKDLTGQNVFRAALARFEDFERRNPEESPDVVAFCRAMALARLRACGSALVLYREVARDPGSALALRASERAEALRPLAEILDEPLGESGVREYLSDLEARRDRLAALAREQDEAIDRQFALREAEQTQVEYALTLFRNRWLLDDGAARALEAARALVEEHAESRRVQAHRLMLGEFHLELARDLERMRPPDGMRFDAALFSRLLDEARAQFLAAAQADGYAEKPEARALLEAAEALADRVRRAAR